MVPHPYKTNSVTKRENSRGITRQRQAFAAALKNRIRILTPDEINQRYSRNHPLVVINTEPELDINPPPLLQLHSFHGAGSPTKDIIEFPLHSIPEEQIPIISTSDSPPPADPLSTLDPFLFVSVNENENGNQEVVIPEDAADTLDALTDLPGSYYIEDDGILASADYDPLSQVENEHQSAFPQEFAKDDDEAAADRQLSNLLNSLGYELGSYNNPIP